MLLKMMLFLNYNFCPVLSKTFHQSFYQKETLSESEDTTKIKGSHVSFITLIFILKLSLYPWKVIKATKSY